VRQESSQFAQNLLKSFYTIPEVVAEFARQPGNFKSPLSWSDKLQLRIAQTVGGWNIFKNIAAIPGYSTSPNWQVLLNYLYVHGVIAEPTFKILPQPNDLPPFYRVRLRSRLNTDLPERKSKTKNPQGYGTSLDSLEEAYSKAVGELLERYFLTLHDGIHSVKSSVRDMKIKSLNLDELPTFLPWQKEKVAHFNYNEHSVFSWLGTKELLSGQKIYAPAQLLYWGYDIRAAKEPFLRQTTTSGEAGGFSYKESALSAIYENIERDAFLIFWLNTISPPQIDVSTIAIPRVQKFLDSIKQYGLKAYFLDTTTDIPIPSCVCIIIDDRNNTPRITVAGSTGFSIEKNIISSAMEALSSYTGDMMVDPFILPKNYVPFDDKTIGREQRIGMWQGKDMLERLSFLISGGTVSIQESRFGRASCTFASLEEEYVYTLNIFRDMGKGYELYCYEAKHPILQTLGYHVTKVVIPMLMPLYLNEHLATLDSKRLNEVPAKLGYTETKLNPWPHPFP
jgi:ribosomal protein S12 methylthiotransferase accessory factor